MENALHKKDLISFLKNNPIITTQDFLTFYRQFTPDIPLNTLRWRIHELKQDGIIYSPKRGLYSLNKKESFQAGTTPKMDEIAILLQEKFPYDVRFNIYPTKWIGDLTKHVYQINNLVIEIDADVLEPAFYFLKERFPNTFLSPGQEMYDYYILPDKENIIINRLYVDAPLNKIEKNYYTPKLEKLIVDLLINDPVIYPVGNAEVETIIEEAFNTYNVNYSTLTRYANKRNAKRRLDDVISLEGVTEE